MKTINVNKLTSVGCKVKIWIADWFAQLNDKMDGEIDKIQTVGSYLIEVWKAAGMNIEGGNVEILWSSEEIMSRPHEYWPIVMDIAWRNKLSRIIRCCQIMGRKEEDKLTCGHIFYLCMQFADIFFLNVCFLLCFGYVFCLGTFHFGFENNLNLFIETGGHMSVSHDFGSQLLRRLCC
ncbi:putative tyrosine--tRNA ligase [Helianthus anomalus]